MKRLAVLFILLLALTACGSSLPELVPVETVVAQTMTALAPPTTPLVSAGATQTQPATETSTPSPAQDALGAGCLPAGTEAQTARVTRILDGETIEVALGNDVFPVRYLGVRAPEFQSQPGLASPEWFGPEALAANRRLVGSQVVTLVKDVSDRDADGNLLRYVLAGEMFVNYELVRLGFAQAAPVLPDIACQDSLAKAEETARSAAAGLWGPTPVPTSTATPTPTNTPDVTATPTLEPACDCQPKDKDRVSCNSFASQADSQACFEYCKATGFGDVFGLDKNGNGKTCEGMP